MGPYEGAMRHYGIFVLKDGHIKEPARIISCPDDEAATEEARQLLDSADENGSLGSATAASQLWDQ